jgi:hypothetical protein
MAGETLATLRATRVEVGGGGGVLSETAGGGCELGEGAEAG